ncbi:MAG TPA: methionyl-tRNA formyltransferase [Firmicutes bacterium]|nr:methionyl-tRNA formyltransferase [Bacillota bacterium]
MDLTKGDVLLSGFEIHTFDAPVLRKKAKPVRRVNNKVREQLDAMLEAMRAASGVGLAAPQVGISKRMVVIDVGEGPHFLINPEIVSQSAETETKWEGCLSWPGYLGEVERPVKVCVKALNRDGHEIWVEGEGLLARALCHELDHLDGVLFIDRAKSIVEVEDDFTGPDEALSGLKCIFMGSPEFALPSLDGLVQAGADVGLVVTQPDRPYGRKKILTPTPVKQRALELGLEVFTPENISSPEAIERLRLVEPDFIAVAAYGQRIPAQVLELPKYACLNVHPSLLPKYRGGNPIQRQIMAGEQKSGVTIIYMSERMDAGDVCVQKTVDVDPNETYGTLERHLSVTGADALIEAIALVYTGAAARTPQDEGESTYAPHLKPGEEIIDWQAPAEHIHNLVRALSPVPGAVTLFGTERTKIWRTQLLPSESYAFSDDTAPGTILKIDDTMAVVRCGQGVIGVLEVQPAGKTTMIARAFLVGRQDRSNKFG